MIEECKYALRCLNNENCYRCNSMTLLKLKEDKMRSSKSIAKPKNIAKANADDSWNDLEDQVAEALNNVPNIEQARRTIASGALFEKGDIKDMFLHPECKERLGTLLKSGDRSISIQRLWLEKAKHECQNNDKFMCLPFRFKTDDNIYCIMDFDDIANLVCLMKSYVQDNDILRKENEILKKNISK